jgi:membrane associated rhomboid family serine protease
VVALTLISLSLFLPATSSSSTLATTTLARARRRAPPRTQSPSPWNRYFVGTSSPSSSSSSSLSSSLIDDNSISRNDATAGGDIPWENDENCFILDYESDFDDDGCDWDDTISDVRRQQHPHHDEIDDRSESISSWADNYSFRGGAAAASASPGGGLKMRLPGLHSGWRRKRNQPIRRPRQRKPQQQQQQVHRGGSNPNTTRSQDTNKKSIQLRRKLEQLDNIHQQKMHQIRRAFRRKQREFHNLIYNLNSRRRSNNNSSSSGREYNHFPKPPYTLWTLDRSNQLLHQRGRRGGQQIIGKTTLTGKIFLFNILMFGLQTIYPQLTSWGAKRSDMILEGRQLHRLLTPVFLHGGLGHLMANSYSLKSMGVNVEMAFGQPRLLATYLVSGIMGNVMSAIQSPNPAVGASGAIFGLVGAYYTFLARNQHLFGYTGQMQKDALVETIGFNLLLGMTNPMIDNWGHIGGFVGGVGMAYLIGPKLYVARVPLLGGGSGSSVHENTLAAGLSAGKIIIDRPTISFRTPEFVNEGIFWIDYHARKLGRSVSRSLSSAFNNGGGKKGEHEYFVDSIVDYCNGMSSTSSDIIGNPDIGDGGTIYRTLKDGGNEAIQLEGNVNVNPSDGFRQNVNELDPTIIRRQGNSSRRRWRAPAAGHSIRPRYGHLYR